MLWVLVLALVLLTPLGRCTVGWMILKAILLSAKGCKAVSDLWMHAAQCLVNLGLTLSKYI